MNYLLTGPEEYLKHEFLEKLKKSVFDKSQSSLDFEAFQAGASDITEILNSLNTLPFTSKHRIVLIRDIEKFSSKEKDRILKYLKSPANSASLLLSGRAAGFNKFVSEVAGLTKVIRCERLKPRALLAWIGKEFAARKKKISLSLINAIIERSGDDLFLLKNEIEKVSVFAKDGEAITARHIERVLGKSATRTAYELVDLILQKKLDRVFLAIDSLLLREKPHRILSLLAWQFRNSGDFTKPDLKKKFDIILEGDLSIKRGTMLPEDALERVLVRLCG